MVELLRLGNRSPWLRALVADENGWGGYEALELLAMAVMSSDGG